MARPKKESVVEVSANSNIDLSLIDKAVAELQKTLGEDVATDTQNIQKIARVKLSSPKLGYIMGDGGCPKGRIIEIYGPESSGKSLLSQFIGADYQREGGFVAYIDTEHTFSVEYANVLGLKTTPDCFRLFQPNSGEAAFTVAEKLAETGQISLIIFDSVAAMTPEAELAGEMTDNQMGAQARMMGKGIRKITGMCSKNNTTVIFINQLRMKIGVMFGSPETTPGGQALKFFSSIRLDVRKAETSKGESDEDDALGIVSRVKCIKNKTAVPFRKIEMKFDFKTGVDIFNEYIDFAVSLGIVDKKGAWYGYKEEKLGQGSDNVKKFFRENPIIFEEVKTQVDRELSNNFIKTIDVGTEPTDEKETVATEIDLASLALVEEK
jgi:recombination protein RecA